MSYIPVDVVLGVTETELVYKRENTWNVLHSNLTIPLWFIWQCGTHYVYLDGDQYRCYTLGTGVDIIIPPPEELEIRYTVCTCNNTVYLFGRSEVDMDLQVTLMYYLDLTTITWVRLTNPPIGYILTSISLNGAIYCVETDTDVIRLHQYTIATGQWRIVLVRRMPCMYLCSIGPSVYIMSRYKGVVYNTILEEVIAVDPTTVVPHATFGKECFDFYTVGGVTYVHDYSGDENPDRLFMYTEHKCMKICDLPPTIKWTFPGSISAELLL